MRRKCCWACQTSQHLGRNALHYATVPPRLCGSLSTSVTLPISSVGQDGRSLDWRSCSAGLPRRGFHAAGCGDSFLPILGRVKGRRLTLLSVSSMDAVTLGITTRSTEMLPRAQRSWSRCAASVVALFLVAAAPGCCCEGVGAPSLITNPEQYFEQYHNAGPEEQRRVENTVHDEMLRLVVNPMTSPFSRLPSWHLRGHFSSYQVALPPLDPAQDLDRLWPAPSAAPAILTELRMCVTENLVLASGSACPSPLLPHGRLRSCSRAQDTTAGSASEAARTTRGTIAPRRGSHTCAPRSPSSRPPFSRTSTLPHARWTRRGATGRAGRRRRSRASS
jgi:hypothetical protein